MTRKGSKSTTTLANRKVGKSRNLKRSNPTRRPGPRWNGVNGMIPRGHGDPLNPWSVGDRHEEGNRRAKSEATNDITAITVLTLSALASPIGPATNCGRSPPCTMLPFELWSNEVSPRPSLSVPFPALIG